MRDAIAGLSDQLRWAVELDVPVQGHATDVVICGVGGSMYAGEAAAEIAALAGIRVAIHRGYGLPNWALRVKPHVIAVTYSGNTEETLSALDVAKGEGLDVSVVSSGGAAADAAATNGWVSVRVPGGLPPRVAAGYQMGSVLRILESVADMADQRPGLVEAADMVDRQVIDAAPLAADLASALEHRIAVVMGGTGGIGAVAARRWKAQINENSKLPAFAVEIPEANHNDLEGWAGGDAHNLALVALHDSSDHRRVTRRLDKTMIDLAGRIATAGNVQGRGTGPLARLFSLTVVGDLVSVDLAEKRGVDPYPIDVLESFKKTL